MSVVILFCLFLWILFGVFGIECVSVTEGDSVTLSVNLNETQRNEGIKWQFGSTGIVIAEITDKGQNITVRDNRPDGRFRDRLKINKHTGDLTITNITNTHSGLYQVINTNTKSQINIFNITVYARLSVPVITRVFPQNSSSSSSSSSSVSSSSVSSSSSSSVSSCVFVCSVLNVSHVTLSWYKGNSLLSSISVSDLNISIFLHRECLDASYSCVVNNPISNQTQHLTADDCHTCSGSDITKTSSYYILPLSCAAGSLMILTAVLIFCICRKQRKTHQDQTDEQEITYADPTFYTRQTHKQRGVPVEDEVVYAGVMRR